jgi:hypothetical protein
MAVIPSKYKILLIFYKTNGGFGYIFYRNYKIYKYEKE